MDVVKQYQIPHNPKRSISVNSDTTVRKETYRKVRISENIEEKDKEDMLDTYQDYLNSSEYKDLLPQLNLTSPLFCISNKEEEDTWWRTNVKEFGYIDFWSYINSNDTGRTLSPVNWFCKIAHIDDEIFIEIHDEVANQQELTSWLKARIHLKSINGKMVKHGIQEVYQEAQQKISDLKDDGYHIVEKSSSQIKYKLLRSPHQYRAKFYQGVEHGIHFLAEIDYESDTINATKIAQFQDGRMKTSQTWFYPSGKQKSCANTIKNIITSNSDIINKCWYESGQFSFFSYTNSNSIHSTRYDKNGKLVNNLIRKR
jgi:hypothetical protein